jgi:hypothetical protein
MRLIVGSTTRGAIVEMKMFALIALLVFSGLLFASTPVARPWGNDWYTIVTENFCGLNRRYKDHLDLSFSIASPSARVRDPMFEAGALYLSVTPTARSVNGNQYPRITNVSIGEYPTKKHDSNSSAFYSFYLDSSPAAEVMDLLARDQEVILIIHYENGDTLDIQLPDTPRNKFKVWANMLRACAVANVA